MLLTEPALQGPAQQRANGAARIEFAAKHGVTRLVDLYQRAPCRVLFPNVDADEPAQAVLLTTSGGLTGGDSLQVDFALGARACATLTTQAAEKLYRALPHEGHAAIGVRMDIDEGAYAEYLAQETILFDGARLRREFHADVAADARLLALESLVFGRSAMREDFRHGFVHDAWRIRRNGRLVFADALRLGGDIAALRAAPFGFGHARACGTLLYVAPDAHALLDAMRAAIIDHAHIAHATTREGVLSVRFLAEDAAALRRATIAAAGAVRHLAMNLSRRLPQVWYC